MHGTQHLEWAGLRIRFQRLRQIPGGSGQSPAGYHRRITEGTTRNQDWRAISETQRV